MIEIYPVFGPPVQVAEGSITLIAGPYPSDVGGYTYIHGFSLGMIVSHEPVEHFLNRLRVVPPLVQFTRPNRTPVWIKAAAITEVTPPLPRGQYEQGTNAVIWLNRLRQAVVETMAEVQRRIGSAGPHPADAPPLSAVFYDDTGQMSPLDQAPQISRREKRKKKD